MQGPPGYTPPGNPGGHPPPGGHAPPGGYGAPPGGHAPPPAYGPPPGGSIPPPGAPQPKRGLSGLAIALIALGVLVVFGFGGCMVCVGAGIVSGTTASTKPSAATPAKQVFIQHLLRDYRENEMRADQKYKNQWVQTRGWVGQVKKGIMGQNYLTVGSGEILEIPMLQCYLTKESEGRAAGLSRGSEVTVRGKVTGLMFHVQMKECQIVP